ncbi:hypothetical protein KVR01_002906 [Diaporthe batatas]|uniref:uncharacterized protein n=1 Tax=Diaporthe batatas TaxID=748121 RepID=UPI001D03AD03|nr:uncharacterized protein KVR01_002906 [Diaporthe batatas]KAG8167217.1 hypothetical protein KVR01_002906 [Diaporthe batatas]
MLIQTSLPRRDELSPPDIDRRTSYIAAWTIQCAIGIIAVALRFWARSMLKTRWKYGWDDWVMLLTLLIYLGGTILVILIGVNGGTRHLAYIQPASHAVFVFKLHQITQSFGIMASGTGKISVAFLIMRFLPNTGKWRQRFLWVLIVITFVQSVTTSIFNFTQCDPVAALWDPALRPTAKCWDPAVNANYGIFGAAWGCAFDMILATMPISLIWKLQLSLRKRLGIIALLGSGVFGAIVTAVKAKELELIKNRSDFTWVRVPRSHDVRTSLPREIVMSRELTCLVHREHIHYTYVYHSSSQ